MIRKTFLLFFFIGIVFSQNCKVIYNDQSVIPGDIQVLDRKFLYFIPKDSIKPEKISVKHIKELRMIDGLLPIMNGSVKYIYVDGDLIKNNF